MTLNNRTTLVFLPGWSFKASIWKIVTTHLSPIPIIMQDFPAPRNPSSFNENSLDEITREIDKSLPDNCILIAWSLGGLLALHLCAKHPEKYKQLILVTSTPKFIETPEWHGISQSDITHFHTQAQTRLPELIKDFHQTIVDIDTTHHHTLTSHAVDLSQQDILRFYLDMLTHTDLRKDYKALQIPVLHIFGSRDPIVSDHHIKHIKKEHSLQRVCTIKGAGHIPFLTHTHEFINQILEFIPQNESPE